MVQYIVPVETIESGTWEDFTTPAQDLYTRIDQGILGGSEDTSQRIKETNNTPQSGEFLLGTPSSTPDVDTGHIVRVVAQNNVFFTDKILYFDLIQGSTTIATGSVTLPGNEGTPSFVTGVMSVTEAEAGNITNYADLRVSLLSDTNASEQLYVAEIEMELPDGGGGGASADSDFIRFENGCMSDFRGMVNIRG